jgi:hypothetical protein
MRTIICYPVPMDNEPTWELFRPYVKRFTDSLRQHDPGCDYEVAAIVNSRADTLDDAWIHLQELAVMFDGLPWNRYHYQGAGCDIGSFQWFARQQTENVFMVCCVTRVYSHRAGWLKKLVTARETLGPGLYGTSASRESGKLHVCTRAYAFDSEDFKKYPHNITSRDQGVFFECGDGCLYEWFGEWRSFVVYWGGCFDVEASNIAYALTPDNIYRRGKQTNCLVFDRHTDAYRDADETEKRRLERMCFEGTK